jgi:tetratricopeptide (TPR) repeat protein
VKELTGKAPGPASPASHNWQAAVVCGFLVLVVLAVFGQTARFGFINYDDEVYVYENPMVQNGLTWRGLLWALRYGEIGHWHPLTWLTHMADCQMYGLWAGGPHLENVALHAISAVVLCLLLRSLTGALWRSAFVAAIFAVHPLRAESVAWIAERKDVLAGMFFMLTLSAYLWYVRQPSRGRYAATALLFCLGLLSKNMLVTMPFVMLLLDYWPLRRMIPPIAARGNASIAPGALSFWALLKEKYLFFLLSAGSCVATVLTPEKIAGAGQLAFAERLGSAFYWYAVYIGQLFFPARLAVPYLYPGNGLPFWKIVLSFAALTGVTATATAYRRKRPYLLVGWLWFLGMLVPVIGLVPISYYTHADRYTYLPSIGLAIAITWLLADVAVKWRIRPLILGGLMLVIVGSAAALGRAQTAYWRDSETLWNRVLVCTSGNACAYFNLGAALAARGANTEAIVQYRKALEIRPDYPQALLNLGTALFDAGEKDASIAQFRKALALEPDYAEARAHLAAALFSKGEKAEAMAQFQKSLALNPDNAEARSNFGMALSDEGEAQEAIAQYRKALEIDPRSEKAEYNLGNAFATLGEWDAAIAHFRKTVALQPDFAYAYYGLASALYGKEEWEAAIAQYRKAIKMKPDFGAARRGLGKALLRKGDYDEAMTFLRVPGENPDPLTQWRSIGDDFLQTGELDEAVAGYRHALQIGPASAEVWAKLGLACFRRGEVREAVGAWQHSLAAAPDQPSVQNNLAWVLATSPNSSLRDGAKAVALAEQAKQLTGGSNGAVLHTLAAAYAETGRFADAIVTARQALELTETRKNGELGTRLEKELALYRANAPVRDNPQ